jgi:hypothetical protein
MIFEPNARAQTYTYLASRLTLSPNRPKWFSSLWYVHPIRRSYLAPRLTLSLNRPKGASTWPTSPTSSIGCNQNDFRAYSCSVQTVHQSCVEINTISKQIKMRFHLTDPPHHGGPLGAAKKIPCPWYIRRKPCSYLAPRLIVSPSGPSELSLDPRHLEVPLGAPKMISKPIAGSEQMGHLSCIEISTISKETKTSFHLTHIT